MGLADEGVQVAHRPQISTCEPGKKAFTPPRMVTGEPAFPPGALMVPS